MLAAYHRRLTTGSTEDQIAAARAWSLYEGETITLLPDPAMTAQHDDGHFALAFARLETHYFVNDCWLEPGQLLRDADKLRHIPGTIVHGRYDMPCNTHHAWTLHKAWPEADFHLIEGAGHAFSEPGILDRLIVDARSLFSHSLHQFGHSLARAGRPVSERADLHNACRDKSLHKQSWTASDQLFLG